jgi:hypothetical protein
LQIQLITELFRRKGKIECFVLNGDVIHSYLGYNSVAVPNPCYEQWEIRGKSTPAMDSAHCIHKGMLCSGSNALSRISGEVRNSLDGEMKRSVDHILCGPSAK